MIERPKCWGSNPNPQQAAENSCNDCPFRRSCRIKSIEIDPHEALTFHPLPAAPADGLANILTERGSRYGKFTTHAAVTQEIKQALFNCRARSSLAADQVEALEMIAHKLGRIVNGDPDYADSWVDIAGYAKLVADRLEGVER